MSRNYDIHSYLDDIKDFEAFGFGEDIEPNEVVNGITHTLNTLNLLDVIGHDAGNKPDYCSSTKYEYWERIVAVAAAAGIGLQCDGSLLYIGG